MRRLLPLSGIKFEEIPRLKKDNDEYVSATKVRKLLKVSQNYIGTQF